ncbi:MAG: CDGSH iron-sulfur domain-containing protein [Candidatus Baltobacteraceae bacterium]
MSDVRIKVRENGPYLVTGLVTIVDADGNRYETADDKGNIALCRCGGSTTKPFCDGTHSRAGFAAAERAVRTSEETRSEDTP